jgi:hypothetical protein
MKVVSFSLWGSDPKYTVGAVRNAQQYAKLFPEWKVAIWHDKTVPASILSDLRASGAMVYDTSNKTWCPPSMWRFLVIDQPDMERFISRDCDSRPSQREFDAVESWENGFKPFHVIRDHPWHRLWPVQAGMFGMKKGFIEDIEFLIRSYKSQNTGYGHDQNFLRDVIWPKAKNASLQHDYLNDGGCFTRLPPRTDKHFIGERYDENDVPNATDRARL